MKVIKQEITISDKEVEFLEESNAIEGVYDTASLQQAIYAWDYLRLQDKLTTSVILKTHKILMIDQPIPGYLRGYFRDCDVSVGGQIKLKIHEIKPAIENWVKEVETDILGMRRLWKQRHVEYENIHPFIDGNGRTGRMFMNWQRLKLGLPILVIMESEKHDYYQWFK